MSKKKKVMLKADLLKECQKELQADKVIMAKEEIKDRLIEIEAGEAILKEMKGQLEDMLKEKV